MATAWIYGEELGYKVLIVSTFDFSGTVLHPQCKVWATGGSIIFGSGNIVEENAVIINRGPDALFIGDNNVFEVGSVMEGAKLGNRNTLEVRSHVKGGTWLGDDCVIGAVCTTNEGEVLEDKTVIYGDNNERRVYTGSRTSHNIIHTRHLDYLFQTLPKFNHSRSSS
ncbi:hypothetical protein BGX27_002355 [Mortierella sp. AM989]|nr:hypothetical protein BGX27_002355 [Mortierella sp. AM989]